MKKTSLIIIVIGFVMLLNPFGTVANERKFILKTPVAINSKLPIINHFEWFAKQVAIQTNKTVIIKIFQPGSLVPPFEIQTAVSKGQVEAGFSGTIYQAGKFPSAPLFTSFPFGPKISAYLGWYYFGNGQKLLDEFYAQAGYQVKAIPLLATGIESGGWFNKKIEKIEDIKGLRLRWPGLGGKVLSKFGASVSTMPAAEIFPAMEKGVIDGTEFGNPVLDNMIGMPKVAKYAYFPGWHQPSTIFEFTINKKIWDAMSEHQQHVIQTTAMATNLRSIAKVEAKTGLIIEQFKAKPGLAVLKYPTAVLEAFRKSWQEVASEASEKDPFFKKVYQDLEEYMKQQKVWENCGLMP